MIHIAILITVFNRITVTLKGIESLKICLSKLDNFSYQIYLVDDKSRDGTADILAVKYPDIKIIHGNGNLFWNRGMNLAWSVASAEKDYDFYLFFNDDGILFEDALTVLLQTSDKMANLAVISGAFQSKFNNEPTYGGMNNQILIKPDAGLISFDWLNGNLALIPRVIFERIGMLDSWFHHGMGDLDYGLRAIKAGFKLILTPKYIGYCERHDVLRPKCYNSNFSLFTRLKFLYSPLGPNPIVNSLFFFRHYNIFSGIEFISTAHILTFFPCLLGVRNRLKMIFSKLK